VVVVLPASPLHKGRKEYTKKTNEKNTHTEQNLSLSLKKAPPLLSLKGLPPLLCVCAFVCTDKQKREEKRKILIFKAEEKNRMGKRDMIITTTVTMSYETTGDEYR